MDCEIAIRGGTVVDGTGAPPRRADIGIRDGRVVEIADTVTATTEIDATGRLVAPGFVDIHTHFDPQVLWDPVLAPSSRHGVTSVVAGNCGYSLAPNTPAVRELLLSTLEKIEDMSLPTLRAGVDWSFESYGEYLAAIERRGVAVNFGGYVGHTAIRLAVMGDDGYEREASADEVERMRALVAASIRGGALGFSSDRAGFHTGDKGRRVPSIIASQAEVEALMRVTADIGQGVVHVAPGENFAWLYDFQRTLGRRVNWSALLTYPPQVASRAPYRDKLARHLAERQAGADVWVQVTCRPIVQQITLMAPAPFSPMPSFGRILALPPEQRARLYADPAWRDQACADWQSGRFVEPNWRLFTIAQCDSRPDLVGRSVQDLAAERGIRPLDAACEVAVADGLDTRFNAVFANDDEDGIRLLVGSEGCIMGLSDAGAHVSQICDAVMPTDFLANWVRDRGVMPVEAGIRKLSAEIAGVLGLDRGTLQPGRAADIVVLDWDRLAVGPIRRVADMPAGGERLVAPEPQGIDQVLVNGVPIVRNGSAVDGALPGQILRSRA